MKTNEQLAREFVDSYPLMFRGANKDIFWKNKKHEV
jgi:hypothetical protein